MVECSKHSSLVLKVLTSEYSSCAGFFRNNICSPNGEWVPDFLHSSGRSERTSVISLLVQVGLLTVISPIAIDYGTTYRKKSHQCLRFLPQICLLLSGEEHRLVKRVICWVNGPVTQFYVMCRIDNLIPEWTEVVVCNSLS